ncbi:MAG: class I SAM-dependent RNA methyltransferase [Bacteroidales bacterium]|nr:class I SAM-dependent RNA methyltransferase [Bacteroidales bacterium]
MKETQIFPIVVKTHAGLEQVLSEELIGIGASNPEILKRAVKFNGNNALLYKANYCCGTAIRVLKQIDSFFFNNNEEFYSKIKALKWETYLDAEGTLAVDAFESQSIFNNSLFIARLTKDAIVDRFRELVNKRPNVDLDNPDIKINIHVHRDNCIVSVDSSGMSLHKRGYRKANVEAPVNEVTAAGIIRLSGWKADTDFFDPMCGSGTLLIEAAMFAMKIPSGYYRKDYGFMTWKDFDKTLFDNIRNDANAQICEHDFSIFGADINKKNLGKAEENLKYAQLHQDVILRLGAFENSQPPFKNGILITNPPYGERLQIDDIINFYKTFGNTLKSNYAGFTAWVFAQENEGLKHIGLRPSRRISLLNGNIECKLMRFDMYEGKKFSNTGL